MSKIILLLLLSVIYIIKSHECIHDKLDFHVDTIQVDYGANNDPERRRLALSDYEPIRIKPYWGEINVEGTQLSNVQKLASAALRWVQSAYKVIPVAGNLTTAVDYVSALSYCGEAVVPITHLDGAVGVPDVDIIIYVTTSSDSCGGGTVAWAHHCRVDQYGRPISGTINICPDTLNDINWKTDVETVLHELLHVLVFSPDLFTGFGGTTQVTNGAGFTHTYITSDKVKAIARAHFGCNSLQGAPLEDDGGGGSVGSHWEETYLNYEVMQARGYGALQVLSDFTMALMEDSGWYVSDYNYSEPYDWGLGAGCDFFDTPCIENEITNFPQFFCDTDLEKGCTPDYIAPALCYFDTYSNLQSQHRYFSDTTQGGWSDYAEYCPFTLTYPGSQVGLSDFEFICWDERGTQWQASYENYGGLNSRCVNVKTLNYGGACVPITCNSYNSVTNQYASASIEISTTTFQCNQGEMGVEKTAGGYTIDCPRIDAICKGVQPFACKWGYYSNDLSQCICSPGYQGSTCATLDNAVMEGVNGVMYYNIHLVFIIIIFSLMSVV